MAASSEKSAVIAIFDILSQTAEIADSVDKGRRHAALNQLKVRLLSTLLGLTASVTFTYFGFKYLATILDPTKGEKQESLKRANALLRKIGIVNPKFKLTEYEMCIACNLVHEPELNTSWQDIGGLEDTIRDIQQTVILPFKHLSSFSGSKLLQPPKGVLLYGPPGCGKTLIAKATAKEAGARFINLQLSSLVDKWYGESQKRAEAVFSLAVKLQPTIIFIDEIDSLLRSRTSNDHEATGMIKTQFMSLWDGLLTDPNCRVMVMGATNRAQDVDQAILRRMPCTFYVGLPDVRQRKKILEVILCDEQVAPDVDLQQLAEKLTEFNGSDIREVCRAAALNRARILMENSSNPSAASSPELAAASADRKWSCITRQDFELAVSKMKSARQLKSLVSAAGLELD